LIRFQIGISAESPIDFKSIRTMTFGTNPIDGYMIEFSVATDLPAIAGTPDNPPPDAPLPP